jgi:hypothetical protein
MDGAATLRRIAITSRQGTRSHRFELTLFLPNKPSGPRPVFLLINNRPSSNTDPTRKEKSGFWPAEQVITRGYGIAAFHYAELAPDDEKTYRDGVIKFFDEDQPEDRRRTVVRSRRGRGAPAARWTTEPIPASTRRTSSSAIARRQGGFGPGRRTSASRWSSRMSLVKAALRSAGAGETIERIHPSRAPTRPEVQWPRSGSPVDQHAAGADRPRLYVASADGDLVRSPGEFRRSPHRRPCSRYAATRPIRPADMPAVDAHHRRAATTCAQAAQLTPCGGTASRISPIAWKQ